MQQGIGYGEDIFGNPPSIEHTRLHMIIFSKFTTTIWSIMVHDSNYAVKMPSNAIERQNIG